jgi:hypothetical protein
MISLAKQSITDVMPSHAALPHALPTAVSALAPAKPNGIDAYAIETAPANQEREAPHRGLWNGDIAHHKRRDGGLPDGRSLSIPHH